MPATREQVIEYLNRLSLEEIEELLSEVPSIDQGYPNGIKLDTQFTGGVAYGVLVPDEVDYSFDLYLDKPGVNRIPCMKLIRELTGLGLDECKKRVDSPSLLHAVKTDLDRYESRRVRDQFKQIGAQVVLKGQSTGEWYAPDRKVL